MGKYEVVTSVAPSRSIWAIAARSERKARQQLHPITEKQLLRNVYYLIHQGGSERGLVSLMQQQLFQPGIGDSIPDQRRH
jgi:hypothetical protein